MSDVIYEVEIVGPEIPAEKVSIAEIKTIHSKKAEEKHERNEELRKIANVNREEADPIAEKTYQCIDILHKRAKAIDSLIKQENKRHRDKINELINNKNLNAKRTKAYEKLARDFWS